MSEWNAIQTIEQEGEMARTRKKHVQQDLTFKTHGGKRRGAGRPAKGKRSSEPHKVRRAHDPRHPVHVTIRVADDIGSLRRRDMYAAIREATITTARRQDFRIVHFTIQGNHLHLLVEAASKTALSRGMQGFQISAAKHINAAITARTGVRRSGAVFPDHYHSRALSSPRAVRHALAYVLNNWRRHGEDRAGLARRWKLDPFSTAVDFAGWKELESSPCFYRPPASYKPLLVWLPETWLLRTGWAKYGPISVYEVPGPQHRR
jgi:REP element-mobilizing transposase RayT